jgi:hypothetical protein
MIIVQLEKGVWLTGERGVLPRTLKKEEAKRFTGLDQAAFALEKARAYGEFKDASLIDLDWLS